MANSEAMAKLDLSDIVHSIWGFPVVQVKVTMTNQDSKTVVTALNEVELPY